MPPAAKPPVTRFWPKVDRRGDAECWPWLASQTKKGYGKFGWSPGKTWINAHRASWIFHNGPVPDDLEIDHLCHNPSCVNPAHLEAVTHAENMRRMGPAQATRCQRGHEYDGSTSATTGRRYCHECQRIRDRSRVRDRRKSA